MSAPENAILTKISASYSPLMYAEFKEKIMNLFSEGVTMKNRKLDLKDMILLDLCRMAIGELPKTFSEHNENMWKAFRLGREFETTPRIILDRLKKEE